MTKDDAGALLISVILPETAPAEAGAKPTLKEDAPPGARESGKASPDVVNPVPARVAWVTLSVAVPGFEMVSFCVPLVPTTRLPKLRLDGATEICGCAPVPLREIAKGELVAVLTMLMLPTAAPALAEE